MAFLEESAPNYWTVDSPLNEFEADDAFTAIEHVDFAPDPLQHRMLLILLFVTAVVVPFALFVVPNLLSAPDGTTTTNAVGSEAVAESAAPPPPPPAAGAGAISPVFSPEVQHWADDIVRWAAAHNLDPNAVATIMQIESCGDPQAVSSAGAQGLFQVMPFHFTNGEPMQDPNINAMRGMRYFAERLQQTNGDIGRAFAGYNGGHVAAASGRDSWAAETQRYYTWSTGIYEEASSGATTSATLQEWMQAGGASLCRQAANRLGLN